MTIFERVVDIILKTLESNSIQFEKEITSKTILRDELGFDSLHLAELTVRIESEFGIDIFEDSIVLTVGEIVSKLEKLNEK